MRTFPRAAAIPFVLRTYSGRSDMFTAAALRAAGHNMDESYIAAIRRGCATLETREAYCLDLLARLLPGLHVAAEVSAVTIAAILETPAMALVVADRYPDLLDRFMNLHANTQAELRRVWQYLDQVDAAA